MLSNMCRVYLRSLLALIIVLQTIGISMAQKSSAETKLDWQTDVLKAQEISKSTNKPIFAFFTGSDWCGWCHKLQREVFAKPEFVDWASKNVVLLELDFPRRKQLPAELAQQNNGLQQAFQVKGYPTIWMFFLDKDDASKKFTILPVGSLGYPQGVEVGKEEVKFLSDANQLLSNYNAK
jgi:thioredoxin-related protein